MESTKNQETKVIRLTLITLTIALVIAMLICEFIFPLSTKYLFAEVGVSLSLTIVLLYRISYWFAKRAVTEVIEKKRNNEIVAVNTGLAIFFIAVFLGSFINIIEQSIRYPIVRAGFAPLQFGKK